MPIESVMPPNHLILCHWWPLALSLSQHQGLFQWVSSSHKEAKVLALQFRIRPSKKYSESTSFRIDWLDLLAVQGSLKSLLKDHSLKILILFLWAFFVIPWTAVLQAFLSVIISWSLLKFMTIESVMPPNHLILCFPLLFPLSIFPSIRIFSSGRLFSSGGQSIGTSVSASALPVNSQGWFPLGWTGWTSLQSKGLSRVFSNTTV